MTNLYYTRNERDEAIATVNELAQKLGKVMDQTKLRKASGDQMATLIDMMRRQANRMQEVAK